MNPPDPSAARASHSAARVFLLLWISYALLIVYVTTLPFNFVPSVSHALDKLAKVPLYVFVSPTGERASGSDMLQNVVLFMPFGALTVLALRGMERQARVLVLSVAAGGLLSVGVETLQLFSFERVSSLNDVATDTIGSLVGSALMLLVLHAGRQTLARPALALAVEGLYAVLLWGVVVAVATWHPFDATIDVGGIAAKVRSLLVHPWQFGTLGDEGVDAVRYGLFAAACWAWFRQQQLRHAALLAVVAGTCLAAAMECSQLFVSSRMPGLKDVAVGAAGSAVGVASALMLPASALTRSTLLAVVAWLAAGVMVLSPFSMADLRRPMESTPFLGVYNEQSPERTISHAVELTLAFVPLGYALANAGSGKRRWLLVLLVAVAAGGLLEYFQGWIAGRYPDVTDVGIMVLGAVIGARLAKPAWTKAS